MIGVCVLACSPSCKGDSKSSTDTAKANTAKAGTTKAGTAKAGTANKETAETAPKSVAKPSVAKPGGKVAQVDAKQLLERARRLAHKFIIVDGHVDLPYRLMAGKLEHGKIVEDISKRTEKGDFDYPRAKSGGLNAPFMSIYIPAKYQKTGGGKKLADELIDMVQGFAKRFPAKFAIATSPAQIEAQFSKGLISLPMGIENGAAIEKKLTNLAHFHKRGVRYIPSATRPTLRHTPGKA